MSVDVKLTYLKTLVTGKSENCYSEVCITSPRYKDALIKHERNFGQPQLIVCVYLDKLNDTRSVKMQKSGSIINYASMVKS